MEVMGNPRQAGISDSLASYFLSFLLQAGIAWAEFITLWRGPFQAAWQPSRTESASYECLSIVNVLLHNWNNRADGLCVAGNSLS